MNPQLSSVNPKPTTGTLNPGYEQVRGQMHALHLLFGQWHKDFFINKAKEEVEVEQYFLA